MATTPEEENQNSYKKIITIVVTVGLVATAGIIAYVKGCFEQKKKADNMEPLLGKPDPREFEVAKNKKVAR